MYVETTISKFFLRADLQWKISVNINNKMFTGCTNIQNNSGFNPYSPWNIVKETGGPAAHCGTMFTCS